MHGHRYKRRGWFNEPHRHALAAKGISTGKYFAVKWKPAPKGAVVKWMTPEEYLWRADRSTPDQFILSGDRQYYDTELEEFRPVHELAAKFRDRDIEVDPLGSYQPEEGGAIQQGRHRAFAAHTVGIKEVPVITKYEAKTKKEIADEKKSKGKKTYAWKNEYEKFPEEYEVREVPVKQLWVMRAKRNLPDSVKHIGRDYGKDREIEEELEARKQQETGREWVYVSPREVMEEKARRMQAELEEQGFHVYPWKIKYEDGNEFRPRIDMKYRKPAEVHRQEMEGIMRPVHADAGLFSLARDTKQAERYMEQLTNAVKSEDEHVPMVGISRYDQRRGYIGEGRHRILAAERAGMEKVPVVVEKPLPKDEVRVQI